MMLSEYPSTFFLVLCCACMLHAGFNSVCAYRYAVGALFKAQRAKLQLSFWINLPSLMPCEAFQVPHKHIALSCSVESHTVR
jgi:hypothetical protein